MASGTRLFPGLMEAITFGNNRQISQICVKALNNKCIGKEVKHILGWGEHRSLQTPFLLPDGLSKKNRA